MDSFPKNLANVGSPQVQSRPALREKFMALVDRCNSGDRASLVVEDLVSHMWRNA